MYFLLQIITQGAMVMNEDRRIHDVISRFFSVSPERYGYGFPVGIFAQ